MQTGRGERRAHFWLIVGGDEEGGEPRPLTIDVLGGERALAVFSFEEEAQMYLLLSSPRGRWCVKETCPEALTSLLLSGGCSGTQRVVLDPVGEIRTHEANYLLSTSRERFLGRLLAPDPAVAAGSSTRTG